MDDCSKGDKPLKRNSAQKKCFPLLVTGTAEAFVFHTLKLFHPHNTTASSSVNGFSGWREQTWNRLLSKVVPSSSFAGLNQPMIRNPSAAFNWLTIFSDTVIQIESVNQLRIWFHSLNNGADKDHCGRI